MATGFVESNDAEFEDKEGDVVRVTEQETNASGHKDQLKRQYGLFALCALAINIDIAWVAFGGSVALAIGKSQM
jgi:choline transport protein